MLEPSVFCTRCINRIVLQTVQQYIGHLTRTENTERDIERGEGGREGGREGGENLLTRSIPNSCFIERAADSLQGGVCKSF